MLFNPASAPFAEFWLNPFKAAAATFAVEAISAPVHDGSELDSVIAAQAREANSGLIAMPDTFTITYRAEITSLAARYHLPAVYPYRFFAEVGGLLSYGVDETDNFRRAATYVDRILKGAKPSELPVQAPVKFELVINLKAATALGLTVPPAVLARADGSSNRSGIHPRPLRCTFHFRNGSDSVIRRCRLQCLLCPKADTAGRFVSTRPNLGRCEG
jgi:putative tryptophan/tyrosine transport system substrate-binding protein